MDEKNSIIQKESIKCDVLGAFVSCLCQISELTFIHRKKFGIVPLPKQIKKMLGEVKEFEEAKNKEEQIEELIDIFISACGVANSLNIDLTKELQKKLKKVIRAEYKDNFQHVGKYHG